MGTGQVDSGAAPRRRGAVVRELVVVLLVVVVVTTLVRSFLVAPYSIPSASMEQTLLVGDRILVDRLSYHLHDVRRGDVVVFDGTQTFGRLGTGRGETDYVKRVIGLPGDHVVSTGHGPVRVNGRPLHESAYVYPGDHASDTPFDVRVPPGHLWLMGDHRSDSLDSRAHLGDAGGGMVPEADVVGRVFAVVWPLDRIGGLPKVP